jgi:transmembrane sensor
MKKPGDTLLDWPLEAGIGAEIRAQVAAKVKVKKARRRKARAAVAAVAVLTVLVAWGVPFVRDTARVSTPYASREKVVLADGTRVQLNARTRLSADLRYGRRHVFMSEGEAFFEVARDPAHPFVVETPGGDVRVTGTKFNLRVTSPGASEVTLVEGGVDFGQASSAVALSPGQRMSTGDKGPSVLSRAQIEDALAWRDGVLAMDGLTLVEAMNRLSAYNGVKIEVAPAVAGLRPGGAFPLDDLDGFFRALESALPVNVVREGDAWRIAAR